MAEITSDVPVTLGKVGIPRSPACQIIIDKTRDLLSQTSPEIIAKVYIYSVQEGLAHAKDPDHIKMFRDRITHLSECTNEVIKEEYINYIEGLVLSVHESVLVNILKSTTLGILEKAREVQ